MKAHGSMAPWRYSALHGGYSQIYKASIPGTGAIVGDRGTYSTYLVLQLYRGTYSTYILQRYLLYIFGPSAV